MVRTPIEWRSMTVAVGIVLTLLSFDQYYWITCELFIHGIDGDDDDVG